MRAAWARRRTCHRSDDQLGPGVGVVAEVQLPPMREHRPANHARLFAHQHHCAAGIDHRALASRVELAPGAALAVQQALPAEGIRLADKGVIGYAELLVIVEDVRHTALGKEGARLLHGVAVRDAVQRCRTCRVDAHRGPDIRIVNTSSRLQSGSGL